MSAIDDLVNANSTYAAGFGGAPPKFPQRHLAVLTCMDSRLDLLGALGLEVGEAHFMRNAGGMPTDDALRSLAISQRALQTREIAVIHHTECGMNGFDDEAFRRELTEECGEEPTWRVDGFADVAEDTRRSVEVIRACKFIPHRDDVRGFVFEVATATLVEVTPAQ